MKYFVRLFILVLLAVLFGCDLGLGSAPAPTASTGDYMSWEEYRGKYVRPFGDKFVVEGDILMATADEAKASYYRSRFCNPASGGGR
jgi:hypothetical protein